MAPFMRARKMGERRKTNINSDNSVMCSGSGDTEQGTKGVGWIWAEEQNNQHVATFLNPSLCSVVFDFMGMREKRWERVDK